MSKRDLTKNEVDDSQPIILDPGKITVMRYVTVGEDNDRIAGVKVEGRAYALQKHPSNPEKFTRASKPLTSFYVLPIWDVFAGEILDYEQKELKRDNKKLAFLVGPAGFIKLYDGTYTVSQEQVMQVTSAFIAPEGRGAGLEEGLLDDEEENSLSI